MTNKKQNILFVVCSYAFFWVLIFTAVGISSGNEELLSAIFPYVQVFGTWTPTFALLVLFKKLYPGWTIKEFYKNAFRKRLNFKILLVVTIAYLFITVGVVSIGAFVKEISFFSLFNFSFSGFIITLFSGATGEESGWRGHLQQSIEKNNNVVKSCIIVGIIWAFWHTPTWINYITSGMIYFIPLDILDKMSGAFIIGICYSRCRNLIVPMWIHFVMNFLINGIQRVFFELPQAFIWYILFEVLAAIGYIVWYIKSSKKEIATV